MEPTSTAGRSAWWRTSLAVDAPTRAAAPGLVADVAHAVEGAVVPAAAPGLDLGLIPAANGAPAPGLATSPLPDLGRCHAPSPALVPESPIPSLPPSLVSLRASLKSRLTRKPEATPRRSQLTRSPRVTPPLPQRTETQWWPSLPLCPHPQERNIRSPNPPPNSQPLAQNPLQGPGQLPEIRCTCLCRKYETSYLAMALLDHSYFLVTEQALGTPTLQRSGRCYSFAPVQTPDSSRK